MSRQVGEYYYAPHRRQWGVWKQGKTINGVTMNEFIMDFKTQVQASEFVKKMNGLKPNNNN